MSEPQKTQKSIKDLKPGEIITGFFVVRKSELKTRKDGEPYLHLELGDRTGRITANIWDNAKQVYEQIHVGTIVKLKGTVRTYQDILQLSIERIRNTKPDDNVHPKQFLPKGEIDTDSFVDRLYQTIESIKDPSLLQLLKRFFDDSDWFEKFKEAPGGKLWHHAYLGGLLEHTMCVVEICKIMAQLYPKAHRDLLITGALLHDIGKIDEYGHDGGFFDFTDEGRLWGHISMGAQQVRNMIEGLEKEEQFPVELKRQIIHLILSHQGELEHGSPVLPATLEAIILYYSDEMDSKANAIKHIIDRDTEPGRTWSQYIRLLDRFIYLKEYDPEENTHSQSLFDSGD